MSKNVLSNAIYYSAILSMVMGTSFLIKEAIEFHKNHNFDGLTLVYGFAIAACVWALMIVLKMKNISKRVNQPLCKFNQ